jgi:hypothetical protein
VARFAHDARVVILPVERAQKRSPQINVELVDGQEVFGQPVDGITSQPHSGYPWWGTEHIGNLGQLRQPPMLKAWHPHGNTPAGRANFYSLFAPVGKKDRKERSVTAAALVCPS